MKQESINIINTAISKMDWSKEPMIVNEKDIRRWFFKNYKRLGISKILETRWIHSDKPDFKISVNDDDFEVDLMARSNKFINVLHRRDGVEALFCGTQNHQKEITIPIFELPMSVVSRKKARKIEEDLAVNSLDSTIIKELEILNIDYRTKTSDIILKLLEIVRLKSSK